MKVERNSPVPSARSVAQTAYAKRVEAAAGPASLDSVGPAASVLGIPEAEFTPKVRDAIMGLMSEVDSLKAENAAVRELLRAMQEQQKALLEQVERMQRRLDDVATAATQTGAPPAIARFAAPTWPWT